VYDSDPERELRETEAKASALLPAVGLAAGETAVVEEVTVA
jgi:anthranilate/para-aminobenzoate synthase component I